MIRDRKIAGNPNFGQKKTVVSGAPTLRPSRFGGFTFRLQPMDTERSDITGQTIKSGDFIGSG